LTDGISHHATMTLQHVVNDFTTLVAASVLFLYAVSWYKH